jgi:hypothetical protein
MEIIALGIDYLFLFLRLGWSTFSWPMDRFWSTFPWPMEPFGILFGPFWPF